MEQRINSTGRSARLAGFLAGARIQVLLCGFLLPGLGAVSTSCSDSEPSSNKDGGADADLPDAWVDNGPLDCGVRPADGSVCVTGRLYDFQTEEPVTPGVENEIFAFYNGSDMRAVRDSPDTFFGRVAPSGRYMTWTNDRQNDRCLALVDVVDGHLPATINCYSDHFAYHPDYPDEHRYYLVSETAYSSWVGSYPGEPDLQSDRPIILGQCRYADWTQIHLGEYSLQWIGLAASWPQHCYPFTEDRLSFVDADSVVGPIQPGGALLYFVPMDFNGDSKPGVTDMHFRCNDEALVYFEIGREDIESGEIELAILNNVPFR